MLKRACVVGVVGGRVAEKGDGMSETWIEG